LPKFHKTATTALSHLSSKDLGENLLRLTMTRCL